MEFLEDHPEVANTLENDHSEDWDAEWHKHLLTMALEELKSKVQPDTYLAFEMYALQNRSAKEIAEFLNISVGSIYTAKSRCIDILQELVRTLDQ